MWVCHSSFGGGGILICSFTVGGQLRISLLRDASAPMPGSSSHRWPLAGAAYHRVPDDMTIAPYALAAACSALCRPSRVAAHRQNTACSTMTVFCADQLHCRLKLSLTRLTGAAKHVKTLPLWMMDASKTDCPWNLWVSYLPTLLLPQYLSYQHPASTYLASEARPS